MTTSYPIILAHGICPFDRVISPFFRKNNSSYDSFHYFRNIRSTLISNGFEAHHSQVSWAADLERRALDLKNEIIRITDHFAEWPRVHIIAHSMGGLDARWMIYKHRFEDRVSSLTTIGTPHLGTSVAEWGLERLGWMIPVAGRLGLNLRGLKDLTRASCDRLGRIMSGFEKDNGIIYQTIAGVQPIELVFAPLRPFHKIILAEEGENDGLVSLKSAVWKDEYVVERLDADHLNQIGWWDGGAAMATSDRRIFEERIREVYLNIARGFED
ncbi:MAG: hypothetical protein SV775_04355 [Thermodesulfobacteriota bacterium]|nr:hypothetical protein [Thermodesulfobacteriota bacterium]